MSQQSLRQASIRAVTSTTYTYEGDWHALWDILGIAAGQFNERMLAYINGQLSTSYTEVNGAMAAFAAANGSTTFQAIGTFTPGFLAAPIAAWFSGPDVAQALFTIQLPPGTVAGMKVKGESSLDNFATVLETVITAINGTDLSDGEVEGFAFSPFADGLTYVRFYITNSSDSVISEVSNTISETIAADTNNLLLVAGGTDDLLLVNGTDKLLLAA